MDAHGIRGGLSKLGLLRNTSCRRIGTSPCLTLDGGVSRRCYDGEVLGMNRSLIRITAYLQIGMTILMATGCAQTQPFFLNESPDLQYYLNSATAIEYPDVDSDSFPDTLEALPPLTVNNHDYQFW